MAEKKKSTFWNNVVNFLFWIAFGVPIAAIAGAALTAFSEGVSFEIDSILTLMEEEMFKSWFLVFFGI